MERQIITDIYYKKSGFIKHVHVSGTNPTSKSWQVVDIDSQAPLSQCSRSLPASKVDHIDVSHVLTGSLYA